MALAAITGQSPAGAETETSFPRLERYQCSSALVVPPTQMTPGIVPKTFTASEFSLPAEKTTIPPFPFLPLVINSPHVTS